MLKFEENAVVTEEIRIIRACRQELFHWALRRNVILQPYWHPSQRFEEPPMIDDNDDLAHVVVLVMALDHPQVAADDWQIMKHGLFTWSSNIITVDRAGAMGDLRRCMRFGMYGDSWVLIETDNAIDWQRWKKDDFPKMVLPGQAA